MVLSVVTRNTSFESIFNVHKITFYKIHLWVETIGQKYMQYKVFGLSCKFWYWTDCIRWLWPQYWKLEIAETIVSSSNQRTHSPTSPPPSSQSLIQLFHEIDNWHTKYKRGDGSFHHREVKKGSLCQNKIFVRLRDVHRKMLWFKTSTACRSIFYNQTRASWPHQCVHSL